MRVFYLVSDRGDGSVSVQFYQNGNKAQELVDSEDYETYGLNEGSVGYFDVEGNIVGIRFSDECFSRRFSNPGNGA